MDWKDQLLSNRINKAVNEENLIDQFDQSIDFDLKSESKDEEMNEEFIEFILQTRKHQMKRDKRKQELVRQENEIEYRDITELENKTKLIESKNPELREDLYGDRAKEIYLKELKLQFNFNEFCDKYQPKFWPLIPINLNIKQ